MVLEKTVSPYDVERVVLDAFGDGSISLVLANNTILLTPVAGVDESRDLVKASESTLDFWDNKEDNVWDHV